eukprot:1842166-Ditylum_brightwellii.AAC.1
MMHKPRHISVHKWIARVIKLNNYLTEFPTLTGIEANKLEDEEILDVLENRIPTFWLFQMDKEGFDASSSTIKRFMETCVCYEEYKPKETKENSAACKSHSERGGKHKAKHKATKKAYCGWGQDSPQHHSKGQGCHYYKYHGEDRSCKNKKVHFSSGKAKSHEASSNGNKDLNAIINEKITAALDHQEKKDLN